MKMSLTIPFFIMLTNRCGGYVNALCFLITLVVIYNHSYGYFGVFYLGILLAKYRYYFINKLKQINATVLILISVIALYMYNISFLSFIPYGDNQHPFAFFWRDYTTCIGGCIISLLALSSNQISNLLHAKPFMFLGEISYSFYLLHLPIIITICSLVGSISLSGPIIIFIGAASLSLILGYLSYLFIEVPFQKLGKRIIDKLF